MQVRGQDQSIAASRLVDRVEDEVALRPELLLELAHLLPLLLVILGLGDPEDIARETLLLDQKAAALMDGDEVDGSRARGPENNEPLRLKGLLQFPFERRAHMMSLSDTIP